MMQGMMQTPRHDIEWCDEMGEFVTLSFHDQLHLSILSGPVMASA